MIGTALRPGAARARRDRWRMGMDCRAYGAAGAMLTEPGARRARTQDCTFTSGRNRQRLGSAAFVRVSDVPDKARFMRFDLLGLQ